jgi:hypothetical protein
MGSSGTPNALAQGYQKYTCHRIPADVDLMTLFKVHLNRLNHTVLLFGSQFRSHTLLRPLPLLTRGSRQIIAIYVFHG